jgi:hypothetical protein
VASHVIPVRNPGLISALDLRCYLENDKLTSDQLDKALQELAQFSHKIPLPPDEAFSRESLYHD